MQSLLETELRKLIKEGESSSVELKLNAPRPTELAERIAGLSNAKGGYIIIGVEDATLRIVGTDPSPTIDTLYRATRFITPMFEFTPHEPEVFNLDGKKVVVATIPPSTGPIYQASGVFWVRRGTNTHPLTMDEVMRLANERGILHWELQSATGTTMSDLDMQKVGLFLKQREAFKQQEYQNRFDTPERILLALKCAVEQNNLVIPTNAGLLFFGYEPQLYLPHTEISCVLLKDELGTGGFLDRRVVTGTLPELIDGCIAFLNRHMTVAGEISGWKRHDYPEHAIGALREAIVNAVVHRDYSRHGERIRLFFYPDRIEIHSPGLLMPGIKVEMMERGKVISRLRNPILAQLLSRWPGGYIEQLGSGVRFMLNETKRLELPTPTFREMEEFIVTFQGRGLLKPPPEEVVGGSQESRLRIAMQYVHQHGSLTSPMYSKIAGVAERTAQKDLELLIERGVLKRVGKTKSSRYIMP